jgi:hypothetical protein
MSRSSFLPPLAFIQACPGRLLMLTQISCKRKQRPPLRKLARLAFQFYAAKSYETGKGTLFPNTLALETIYCL